MQFDAIFLNLKVLNSKKGNSFTLASFAVDGEVFKSIVNDDINDILSDLTPGTFVTLFCSLNIYNENLGLKIDEVLASK